MKSSAFLLPLALVCLAQPASIVVAADYVADFPKEIATWEKAAEAGVMKVSLQDRSLVLENTKPENYISHLQLPSGAPAAPLEITARVKIVSAPADRLVALIWHGPSPQMGFFEWQDIGHYSLFDWTGNQWAHHRVRPAAPMLKQGETNEIAVRVIGKRAYFSLNGATVDYVDIDPAVRPSIGFRVPARTTVQVDALTARAIPLAGTELSGFAARLEKEARKHQQSAGVVPNLNAPLPVPFADEFEHNDAGWPQRIDNTEIAVRDGVFEFEYLSADPNFVMWAAKTLQQKIAGDYEITLVLAGLDGPDIAEAGLVFDLDDKGGRKVFQISRKGAYRFYTWDGKTWDPENDAFTASPLIKTGADAKNELTFRAIGGRGYFLINGSAVHAVNYAGMQGPTLGMIVSAGALARFDRIAVKPLEFAAAARTAEVKRLDAEARAARIAAGPALTEFVETFDNNDRGWWINVGETWSVSLEKGELHWHNKKTSGTYYSLISVPINTEADYQITMRARYVGAANNDQISLVWGNRADNHEHNAFGFSGNGQLKAWGMRDGKYVDFLPWRPSSLLKPTQSTELKVLRIDDTTFLFVNGQVVGDMPTRRLRGDRLGVEVGPGVHGAVDEIKVSYPQYTPEIAAKEKAGLIASLAAAHKKKELGATYSVAAKQDAIDAEAARIAATQPNEADRKEEQKLSRRYENKKMLSVIADRGQPARVTGTETNPTLYYFHRRIGGVDYYFRFLCNYTDSVAGIHGQKLKIDKQRIIVIGVFLTDVVQ